ncbi:exonuclease subunit SbcD [Comamonas composti]|uniref:exonuclease subunit SbcD n=1 Tax=Comamonas composti TaxID=408558 RepID=UPI0004015A78|nr:exonuclease subunit SbcD [Comamonas composti]
MRILHTSDWHLGQHFMGKSRQAEHAALIAWLLEQVEEHAVDAVLIAGDIFDTGAPPSYARELYSQLVVGLHGAGISLLLLGGNHDSVATLGESRALLARLNTQVLAQWSGHAGQHVLELPLRRTGTQQAGPGCLVCALPFLRPRDLVQSQAGQSAQDKQQALQTAIQDCYQQVYAAALQRRETLAAELGRHLPIIATGHLTTVGASSSESVREIYVGSLEAFPSNAFPPVDYLALGHIHKPQKVGGQEHMRYSGSPIALSFDEAGQAKQMLLVDLADTPDTSPRVTPLPVPCFQPMASVQGTLAELGACIQAAAAAGTASAPVWLEVTVAENDYLPDLTERVQTLCQGQPVELLRVKRLRGKSASALQAQAGESLHELDPAQVFARRLALEEIDAALALSLGQCHAEILDSLAKEGDGGGDAAGKAHA